MKFFYAALTGALLGASATLLHLVFFPLGLILGLVANVAGIWAIGQFRDIVADLCRVE